MTSPSTVRPTRDAQQLEQRLDATDVLIVGGFLACIGGIALLSVPWALIIGGVLIAVVGFLLGVRRGRPR